MHVYTIGHGNLSAARFLQVLGDHGIARVMDVRSAPYSRYVSWTNQRPLAAVLEDAGIAYEFAGKELGGRPNDSGLLTAKGAPDYDKMAATEGFERGIGRVLEVVRREAVALLCSELNPMSCHRERLIGRALRRRDCAVSHILADGTLLAHFQESLR